MGLLAYFQLYQVFWRAKKSGFMDLCQSSHKTPPPSCPFSYQAGMILLSHNPIAALLQQYLACI